MIQLATKTLKADTVNQLSNLQTSVDTKVGFAQKVEEAKRLWKNKEGSQVNQAAFANVKSKLKEMCVSVEVCNYCEQNEASDIEHIYPKSFFPEQTFVWDNYLLACKTCNSGYKLDKCFVLDAQDNVTETVRGAEPIHKTVALINPRTENPNDFMLVNLETFRYMLRHNLSPKNRHKAEKTLEILKLNERETLNAARKSAYNHYYDTFERLVNILNAPNINALKNLLRPNDGLIDPTKPLQQIKDEIKENYKAYIQKHQHPSVWYSIKTIANKTNPKWQHLFNQLPEALNW